MLAAVLLVLVAASIATNRMPERWYVPVCVSATGMLLLLARLDGMDAADLGLGPGTVLPGLIWALILVLAVALLYLGGATLPKTRTLFADRRFMTAKRQHVASYLLVRIPFGTVLLEETAFRSVLFAMVTVRYGTGWAMVATSVLFGLWHILPAVPMYESRDVVHRALGISARGRWIAVLATVVGTAAGGFGFALLRVWTDSVLPPIGLHWALNGLGVVVAWWLGRITRGGGGLQAHVSQ